jgi:hypothetical protein
MLRAAPENLNKIGLFSLARRLHCFGATDQKGSVADG